MRMPRRANASPAMAAPFVVRKAKELDLALGKAARRVATLADEEALHDMRVALRKLRTLLRLSRTIYGRFRADMVRGAFSEVQSRTGDLRDEEALEDTFSALGVEDPVFLAWRARRRTREKRLRSELIASLRKGNLARPRKLLAALLLFPARPSRDQEVARFARRAVTRAHKKVDRLRDVPTSDVEQLHALRIFYKELRYAAEMFVEVLPVDLAALIAPAARLQKRLGDIHDIDMGLNAVARARRLPSETRALVAGALAEARARKTRKYLDDVAPSPAALPESVPAPPVDHIDTPPRVATLTIAHAVPVERRARR
jgi:CHAD domain-containing protein